MYHRLKVLLLAAPVFVSLAFAADTAPDTVFKLTGWKYARERKTITTINRVTAGVSIQNASKAAVTDVSATLVLMTGLGEKIAGPVVQKLGTLKAGESKTVSFACDLVPAFQSYSITLQFDGKKKEEWYGNSDVGQPEPRLANLKGQARVVIIGKEATVNKFGTLYGMLHVKNEGAEVAKNVKVTITFVDLNKKKLKDYTLPLGKGTLAGNADAKFPLEIKGVPRNFGGYTIDIASDDVPPETALSGGDFSGVADVEFAHFKVTAPKAKGEHYRFETMCRNGLKNEVENVVLEMIFYGPKHKEIRRYKHKLPGTIKSQDIAEVKFEVPDLPSYEEYEQAVTYSERIPEKAP